MREHRQNRPKPLHVWRSSGGRRRHWIDPLIIVSDMANLSHLAESATQTHSRTVEFTMADLTSAEPFASSSIRLVSTHSWADLEWDDNHTPHLARLQKAANKNPSRLAQP